MNDQSEKTPTERLGSFIGMPEHIKLEAACTILTQAFDEIPYLVGSATRTRDYRDVDVRMIMDDEKFLDLFGHTSPALSALWNLLSMSISLYLKSVTGLPIDFQIQRYSSIKEEDWNQPRIPLGNFVTQPKPSWARNEFERKRDLEKELEIQNHEFQNGIPL